MRSPLLPAAALAASLFLAACGVSAVADDTDSVGAPPAGMCAPDMPDCDDTAESPDGSDEFDSDSARDEARELLGKAEGELAPEVRIGRRGEEHMMLTEDYVLGRMTVALEEDADGVFRVVEVTVELPDGPETFES